MVNGYGSQFKSEKKFNFVNHCPYLTSVCNYMWSFFASGHGKGPHDGAGVVIRGALDRFNLMYKGLTSKCRTNGQFALWSCEYKTKNVLFKGTQVNHAHLLACEDNICGPND